jgi:cardiolipin synthase
VILLVSGMTDVLDGIIARKCNMITPLGKILDPTADKLTQAAVTGCLWVRFPYLWPVFVFVILKETLQLIGGITLYKKHKELAGSRWFGKLYTVVFYFSTLIIIAYPQLAAQRSSAFYLLITMVLTMMVFFFFMYIPVFIHLNRPGATTDHDR